jgi:hypothetical protein
MRHNLDPTQYADADCREVDPPIEVEAATWSAGRQLDWWVKERQNWWGPGAWSKRPPKLG